MPRIVWTTNSTFCMKRLHGFLKTKNPSAARKAIEKIQEGIKFLKTSPQIGKPAEYIGAQYSTYMVSFGKHGYVVLYKQERDKIFIISVKHYLELQFIIE